MSENIKYSVKIIFPKPVKAGQALAHEYGQYPIGGVVALAKRFLEDYPKIRIELSLGEKVIFLGNYWDLKNYIEFQMGTK